MADRSEELWNSMLRPLPRDDMADQLVAPPRNPSAPADWASNLVLAGAGKVGNFLMAPGRAMDQGMTTGEAIPWAGDTAMIMTGGGAPLAAVRGVEGSALGVGLPPRIGRPARMPGISGEGVPEIEGAARPAFPSDPRGPWGQDLPPVSPWSAFFQQRPQVSPAQRKNDSLMAMIQDALKASAPRNSGVPLVNQKTGPRPSTEDVLAAIEAALKLAPKK